MPLGLPTLDGRLVVAVALPIAVPLTMMATFSVGRDRLGDQPGYVAGFGVYWATCAGLSIGLLGRTRIRELFRDVHARLGRPAALGAALVVWPAAGAIATRFIPEVGGATQVMFATIVGVALANAVLEELLWRGVSITLWPRNPGLGWVWPAVGFPAWHFAPQVIHPSAMGPAVFVVASLALGLSWGWVAFRTGSLRFVSRVAHADGWIRTAECGVPPRGPGAMGAADPRRPRAGGRQADEGPFGSSEAEKAECILA